MDLSDRERDELREILWEYQSYRPPIRLGPDQGSEYVSALWRHKKCDTAYDLYFRFSRP